MTAALEGGEWSAARPGRTLPPGKTRYPFYRRLGGLQGRSGRAENLVRTGIRSRTVQPISVAVLTELPSPLTHLSTNHALCCLTVVIGWEPVFTTWYSCWQFRIIRYNYWWDKGSGNTQPTKKTVGFIFISYLITETKPALGTFFKQEMFQLLNGQLFVTLKTHLLKNTHLNLWICRFHQTRIFLPTCPTAP